MSRGPGATTPGRESFRASLEATAQGWHDVWHVDVSPLVRTTRRPRIQRRWSPSAQALADVTAAEAAAQGSAAKASGSGKERHAAEVRMHEAGARIAGAGAPAFATNATVRALFVALKVKKKA